MAYRAAIIGGSGYTGAELLRLLAGHPEIEVVHVTADSNAGNRVVDLYPSLVAAYPGLVFHPFEPGDLDGVDVAFLALPHGQSQRNAGALVDRVAHLVDIGADFRLPAAVYEQWYGEPHQAPELIDRFVFGLPELFRSDIAAHAHVANPGCYPTAASLALAPLLAAGLVDATGLIVDAAAGVFTTNLVAAAPVQLSRRHLAADGQAAAVVLNSGNANAATGEPGLLVAEQTAALAAEAPGCDRSHVLVCSTGLIGIPMPIEPFTTGVPVAAAALAATLEA